MPMSMRKTARRSETQCASSKSSGRPIAILEAISDGHLVPYEIYRAMTARTAARDGFPVAPGEIDWDALDEATRTQFEALFADRDPLIVDPTALERKFA